MKERIEVRNQAELDACVKDGNIAIVMGDAHVEAWGSSHVEAWGSSHVVAWESSHVVAWGSSHVVARGSSHVVAWESSHVEAWESSHVVAWESSHVVAWGNVFVRLFSAKSLKAAASVVVMLHGLAEELEGGQQIKAMEPKIGSEWCEYYGIDRSTSPLVIEKLDSKILEIIESEKIGFDMDSWHGREDCDEKNWCGTTHCRAGAAICVAGKPGFDIERKSGDAEIAGRMIYAASYPDRPIPNFFAATDEALDDIREKAAEEAAS